MKKIIVRAQARLSSLVYELVFMVSPLLSLTALQIIRINRHYTLSPISHTFVTDYDYTASPLLALAGTVGLVAR